MQQCSVCSVLGEAFEKEASTATLELRIRSQASVRAEKCSLLASLSLHQTHAQTQCETRREASGKVGIELVVCCVSQGCRSRSHYSPPRLVDDSSSLAFAS
jgi:hypothetical protein